MEKNRHYLLLVMQMENFGGVQMGSHGNKEMQIMPVILSVVSHMEMVCLLPLVKVAISFIVKMAKHGRERVYLTYIFTVLHMAMVYS